VTATHVLPRLAARVACVRDSVPNRTASPCSLRVPYKNKPIHRPGRSTLPLTLRSRRRPCRTSLRSNAINVADTGGGEAMPAAHDIDDHAPDVGPDVQRAEALLTAGALQSAMFSS